MVMRTPEILAHTLHPTTAWRRKKKKTEKMSAERRGAVKRPAVRKQARTNHRQIDQNPSENRIRQLVQF